MKPIKTVVNSASCALLARFGSGCKKGVGLRLSCNFNTSTLSNPHPSKNNTTLQNSRSFHSRSCHYSSYSGAGPDDQQRSSNLKQRLIKAGFYSSIGLVSVLTGAYLYLHFKERVSYQKFNDHSFRLIHRDPETGDECVWSYVHHFQMKSIPMALSSTMAIVKMNPGHSDGVETESELCLYNVVALTDVVQRELDRLGKVKMIIIPSREHVAFAGQYFKKFILQNPTSNNNEIPVFYCPYGNRDSVIENLYGKLNKEFPNLDKNEIAKHVKSFPPDNSSVPPEWPQHWISQFEVQTVSGMPFLTEVVLLHKPTKTLIACDMVMNYKEPIPMHVDDPNHTPFLFTYAKLMRIYGKGMLQFDDCFDDRTIFYEIHKVL